MRLLFPSIVLAVLAASSAARATFVVDGSFESPAVATYQYLPGGSAWTFAGNAGLNRPPSAFASPAAPAGLQMAFLQTDLSTGSNFGSISQAVNLPHTGGYQLDWLDASRPFFGSYGGQLEYEVLLNAAVLGSYATVHGQPFAAKTVNFNATVGVHTLTFRIKSTTPVGDNTVFLDQVALIPEPVSLVWLAGISLGTRLRVR
jgi:hypothetical protein